MHLGLRNHANRRCWLRPLQVRVLLLAALLTLHHAALKRALCLLVASTSCRPTCLLLCRQVSVLLAANSTCVRSGTYGRVAPRSGLAVKFFIDVGAGVIDQDYRGPGSRPCKLAISSC